jgi:VIT1/CCC1 family predicted Fe2+/Mn2+ transporter
MAPLFKNDVERWRAHLAAERDAEGLYLALAQADRNAARASIWRELAAVEERHGQRWVEKLQAAGVPVPPAGRLGWRPRVLGVIARIAGPRAVLPIVTAMERGDADMYVGHADAADLMVDEERLGELISAISAGKDHHETAPMLAALSAENDGASENDGGSPPIHTEDRAHTPGGDSVVPPQDVIAGREQWHRIGGNSSTSLRAAIFGVNDGLVSNLSLVMGVAGAEPGNNFVLLAGIAGLLAGAFSMAAGEFVSISSQREMFERQIALERDELDDNPQEEERELALIYRAKGLPAAEASRLASALMRDREVALDTLSREELGLDPSELGSPWGAAASSFASFAVGAAIPVVPYLFLAGFAAFLVSVVLSAIALFAVGAGVSLVTGRGLLFSGVRMVLIGGAAAAVTYLVGRLIGVTVAG